MNKYARNEQGGFIKLIIFIVVALLLMRYFNISFSGVVDWLVSLFKTVLG